MESRRNDVPESSVKKYSRGNCVEIMSKEEGFMDSYYEATIVTKLNGDEYIVSYDTLLKDDLSAPLREVITVDDMRPVPPGVSADCFNVGDKVDAFDNDGWWMGKIIGKISSQYYSVHFEYFGVTLNYHVDRLRVHQDFVNGNWIASQFRG